MTTTIFVIFVLLSIECGSSFLSCRASNGLLSNSPLYSSTEAGSERTFANYVIYKSKAAVALKVIPPTFQLTGKSRTVLREGGLLFEFALCSGPKEYDWLKKGTFLLAAAECGELMLLDPTKQGLEFFHDPNMGGELAGQITKKLKLAIAADGRGVFLSLSVNKSPSSTSYSVPVSWGELQVFKSIADYSIPRILGFDRVWDETPNSSKDLA